MQIESVLQTKNQSEPAKNRFSVALIIKTWITKVSPQNFHKKNQNINGFILRVSLDMTKCVFGSSGVSDQARHKPACTDTEAS